MTMTLEDVLSEIRSLTGNRFWGTTDEPDFRRNKVVFLHFEDAGRIKDQVALKALLTRAGFDVSDKGLCINVQ